MSSYQGYPLCQHTHPYVSIMTYVLSFEYIILIYLPYLHFSFLLVPLSNICLCVFPTACISAIMFIYNLKIDNHQWSILIKYILSQHPLYITNIVVSEVLRCTCVQINLRLLNSSNWWCCVTEYLLNQIMPCITRHRCLCKQVCQFKFPWYPPNTENACILSLPYPVVTYGINYLV